MSGLTLVVIKKPQVMVVTVPVLQEDNSLLPLLETTISVNQPQSILPQFSVSGSPTIQCGKAIVMKVATVVLTMEDHGLM